MKLAHQLSACVTTLVPHVFVGNMHKITLASVIQLLKLLVPNCGIGWGSLHVVCTLHKFVTSLTVCCIVEYHELRHQMTIGFMLCLQFSTALGG